jgi:hypothetical protein
MILIILREAGHANLPWKEEFSANRTGYLSTDGTSRPGQAVSQVLGGFAL